MSKDSIMQNGKYCWVCYARYPLHKHHIYGGRNRSISEREGFYIWLCPDHHTGDHGIHRIPRADLMAKRVCQRKYEETHSREAFIRLIGKSYLDDVIPNELMTYRKGNDNE